MIRLLCGFILTALIAYAPVEAAAPANQTVPATQTAPSDFQVKMIKTKKAAAAKKAKKKIVTKRKSKSRIAQRPSRAAIYSQARQQSAPARMKYKLQSSRGHKTSDATHARLPEKKSASQQTYSHSATRAARSSGVANIGNGNITTRTSLTQDEAGAQSPYEFSLFTEYVYKANYAEESERVGNHHWDFGTAFAYNKQISVSLSTGLDYTTVGSTITEDPQGNTYTMSDTAIGVGYNTAIFGHKFGFFAENAFPTSEESQYEGVQSVFTVGAGTALFTYEDIYALNNRLAYTYVGNQYEYSPSTQKLNNDHIFSYSIVNDVAIFDFWHAGINLDVRNAHIINGNWSLKASNTYWTKVAWEFLSAGIAYTNTDFRNPRDRDDNLWFQDRQRRIVLFTLGAGYTF